MTFGLTAALTVARLLNKDAHGRLVLLVRAECVSPPPRSCFYQTHLCPWRFFSADCLQFSLPWGLVLFFPSTASSCFLAPLDLSLSSAPLPMTEDTGGQ